MTEPFEPEIEQRRAQITQARDNLRTKGYRYSLELEILRAQHPNADAEDRIQVVDGNGRVQRIEFGEKRRMLRQLSEEAYAGARRMQEMLDDLPDEDAVDQPDENGDD